MREHQKFAKNCFKSGEFCHFVLKGSKVSESNLNLLKMPPSQPLPPKENALFKRILVSLIKLGFDATNIQTFAIFNLMQIKNLSIHSLQYRVLIFKSKFMGCPLLKAKIGSLIKPDFDASHPTNTLFFMPFSN